jgi:hypothetical protein
MSSMTNPLRFLVSQDVYGLFLGFAERFEFLHRGLDVLRVHTHRQCPTGDLCREPCSIITYSMTIGQRSRRCSIIACLIDCFLSAPPVFLTSRQARDVIILVLEERVDILHTRKEDNFKTNTKQFCLMNARQHRWMRCQSRLQTDQWHQTWKFMWLFALFVCFSKVKNVPHMISDY